MLGKYLLTIILANSIFYLVRIKSIYKKEKKKRNKHPWNEIVPHSIINAGSNQMRFWGLIFRFAELRKNKT